jgi:hypothetical protein
MIKPRGPKAKQRMRKVDAASASSKRAKQPDGTRTLSKVAKESHGTSEPDNGTDVSQPEEAQTIPSALAGQWIVWSADGRRIVGSGATLKDAEEAASRAGETEPIFERAAGMFRR